MKHRRIARVLGVAAALVGLLVLGAATTVGVAWGCAANARRIVPRPTYNNGVVSVDREGNMEYMADVTSHCVGCETVYAGCVPMIGVSPSVRFDRPEDAATSNQVFRQMFPNVGQLPLPDKLVAMIGTGEHVTQFTLAGWPARCVFSRSMSGLVETGGMLKVAEWESEILTVYGFPAPIGPLWPGLAADTAFYASAWFFILLAPRRVRRVLRRRRGACVKCGYDLAGLAEGAACPECGGARV